MIEYAMAKIAWILILLLAAGGCSYITGPRLNAEITLNTFKDDYYPCVKVVFPDAIIYEGDDFSSDGDEKTVTYEFTLAAQRHYRFRIIKKRFEPVPPVSEDDISTPKVSVTPPPLPDWAVLPLAEQYDESVKVYEIPPENGNDKAAALFFAGKDGDIYLSGVVGEIFPFSSGKENWGTSAAGLFLTVDRLVQREKYARFFSLEKWSETPAGKRFIEDMKKQVDWLYQNSYAAECGG
jgi:hypothetical protein